MNGFRFLFGSAFLCGWGVSAQPLRAQAKPATAAKPAAAVKAKEVVASVWRENGAPVMGLSVSPGRVILTDGTDKVWLYAPDGKLQKMFGPVDADTFRVFSYDAAIAPDGKYAIVASVDLAARLLDLDSEKPMKGFSAGMSRLNAVAYSPDGKNVAIASSSMVTVSSTPERAYRSGFKGLNDGAGSVAFSPDGATLAVGGEDKSVHLFKVQDGSEIVAWREHEGAVRALAWSRDGKLLASGGRDGGVLIWDVAAGKKLASIATGEGVVESLAWAAGGTVLAVAVAPPGRESAARPSEPERQAPEPADTPHRVVQLWSVKGQSATLKRAVPGLYGARKIAFVPDGKLLAGFADGHLAAYDLTDIPVVVTTRSSRPTSKPVAPKEDAEGFRALTGLAGGTQVVAWSRDGKLLAASGAESQIGVWDASGAFVRRISGHARGTIALAWSPDGKLLASGGEDRLQVARVADGKVLWDAPGRAVLAGFSPDGKTVYAFKDETRLGKSTPHLLRGWNALTGTQSEIMGNLSYPMRAAISPDGTLVVADQGISGNNSKDSTQLFLFSTTPPDPKAEKDPNRRNGELRTIGDLHGRVNALRWMSASRLLADEGDYNDGYVDSDTPIPGKLGVKVFDAGPYRQTKPFLTFAMPIVALDENTRGELALAEERVAIHVYNAQQQEIATWPLPTRGIRIRSLAWSPDGQVLAISVEGAPVQLWRVRREQAVSQ